MYTILISGSILRFDGACIPPDERNRDYIDFLSWVAEGNVPSNMPVQSTETKLSPSQQIILADGEDVARVTISGEPGATIGYAINGESQSLTLDESGIDEIELTCDTPSTTILVQLGYAKAVIYAVEVPS